MIEELNQRLLKLERAMLEAAEKRSWAHVRHYDREIANLMKSLAAHPELKAKLPLERTRKVYEKVLAMMAERRDFVEEQLKGWHKQSEGMRAYMQVHLIGGGDKPK